MFCRCQGHQYWVSEWYLALGCLKVIWQHCTKDSDYMWFTIRSNKSQNLREFWNICNNYKAIGNIWFLLVKIYKYCSYSCGLLSIFIIKISANFQLKLLKIKVFILSTKFKNPLNFAHESLGEKCRSQVEPLFQPFKMKSLRDSKLPFCQRCRLCMWIWPLCGQAYVLKWESNSLPFFKLKCPLLIFLFHALYLVAGTPTHGING